MLIPKVPRHGGDQEHHQHPDRGPWMGQVAWSEQEGTREAEAKLGWEPASCLQPA